MRQNKFGKELVLARLQMGLDCGREINAGELAKRLGVSAGYLSLLERGKKCPSVPMLARILKVYPKGRTGLLQSALGVAAEEGSKDGR